MSDEVFDVKGGRMSVSGFADLAHVSVSTLRRQDESGEFPARRSEGGHRYYTEDDLDRYRDRYQQSVMNGMLGLACRESLLTGREEAVGKVCDTVYQMSLRCAPDGLDVVCQGMLDPVRLRDKLMEDVGGRITWMEGCRLFAACRGLSVEHVPGVLSRDFAGFDRWLFAYGYFREEGGTTHRVWRAYDGEGVSGILSGLARDIRGFLYSLSVDVSMVPDLDLLGVALSHAVPFRYLGSGQCLGMNFLDWVLAAGWPSGRRVPLSEMDARKLWQAFLTQKGMPSGGRFFSPSVLDFEDYLQAAVPGSVRRDCVVQEQKSAETVGKVCGYWGVPVPEDGLGGPAGAARVEFSLRFVDA